MISRHLLIIRVEYFKHILLVPAYRGVKRRGEKLKKYISTFPSASGYYVCSESHVRFTPPPPPLDRSMEAPGKLGHRQIGRLLTGEQNPLTADKRKVEWRRRGEGEKGTDIAEIKVTTTKSLSFVQDAESRVATKRARGEKKKRRHNRRRPAR